MRKALNGGEYDFRVIRDGYEAEEDLVTDADILMVIGQSKGQVKISKEHSEDMKDRMTRAVPMTDGMSFELICQRLQSKRKYAPVGTLDVFDERSGRWK